MTALSTGRDFAVCEYLYRALDKSGKTVDFLLRAHRDDASARRYFEKDVMDQTEWCA